MSARRWLKWRGSKNWLGGGAYRFGDEAGAAIDETGIELDQRGAGRELVARILAAHDAADCDDGQFAGKFFGQAGDDFGCALGQRRARQAAGFFGHRHTLDGLARERRIRCDHGVETVAAQRVGDITELFRIDIGSNLERDRHMAAMLICECCLACLERAKQRIEFARALQLAQVLGIRRGNVDGDVARMRINFIEAGEVVVGRAFDRRIEVLADIDAEDALAAGGAHIGKKVVYAVVVKPHAVDDRAGIGQTEHAWARVAGLGARRDGADFDMAKTEACERIDGLPVLVETGGQADPVRELDAHDLDRLAPCGFVRKDSAEVVQAPERQIMGGFGVQREKQRAGKCIHSRTLYRTAPRVFGMNGMAENSVFAARSLAMPRFAVRTLIAASLLIVFRTAGADVLGGDAWLRHAKEDLLPFWSTPAAFGTPLGNFPTFRCNDGSAFDAAAPCVELKDPPAWIKAEIGRNYLRMQGRQTYAYGVAFQLTGDKRWLDAAKAGAAHTLSRLDAKGGYPSWVENGKPMPEEAARTAQDQSYNVVGLAMLFYLTRDPQLEKALVAQEQYVFKRFWDKDWGMLRWVTADGPTDEAAHKELVAQLDQLNAYMLLVVPYLSEPARSQWRSDIRRLVDVILNNYYDAEHGRFFGSLDRPDSRLPGGRHNDFGHTIKAYWMLLLAARELGDAKLEAFAKAGGEKVLSRAWDESSRAWGSAWKSEGIDASKSWWIFAELDQMAATLALDGGDEAKYLETSWPFWLKYLTDHRNGEVWGGVRQDGASNPESLKIHQWKNGFHSWEHALVSYLAAQGLAGKPATLHFATGNTKSLFRPYVLPGSVEAVEEKDGIETVRFRLPGGKP